MPNRSRSGYTLIELMVVLSFIAILTAMALPNVHASRFQVDAGMRRLQAVLQQAERSAVMRQTNVMVSVDTTGRRVRVLVDANNNGQTDAGESVRWQPLEDGIRFAAPPSGVACAATGPVCGNNIVVRDGYPTLVFRRDGAASSSAEIYIRSYRTTTDDFRALLLTQATGRVDLYRYGGGQWRRGST